MNFKLGVLLTIIVWMTDSPKLPAAEPRRVGMDEILPFGQKPIDYWAADSRDPVSELQQRIDEEQLGLAFDERFGYLPAVLRELQIPVESQLLLFASGSPHQRQITAERPRAMYFNDDAVVTWFPGAAALEIAAQDSQKGTLFYTLTNRKDADLRFQRNVGQACLGCHHPLTALGTGPAVPGHLVRSFLTIEQAKQYIWGDLLTHSLPIEVRWRSWYVTGISPMQRHLGNQSRDDDRRQYTDDPNYFRHVIDLADEFDTDRYPAPTSDVVAHLIFDHQMLGLNLLSRLSYEQQMNVRSTIETAAVRYLLLADEVPLNNPVAGKSAYAEWHRHREPKDAEGRSLYDLDLETRLFRHRVSPLLLSRMFQGLPAELKQSVYLRLRSALTGREEVKRYQPPPEAELQETLAVLKATVPDWPAK